MPNSHNDAASFTHSHYFPHTDRCIVKKKEIFMGNVQQVEQAL